MDVGALRQVLRRFRQGRRLEDDVKMLTEAGGAPVGRALAPQGQKLPFEAAASNPKWDHVYRAAILSPNTSMRGVEIRHIRRRDVDLERVGHRERDGKGVLYVSHSKNETSKRRIPLQPRDVSSRHQPTDPRATHGRHGKAKLLSAGELGPIGLCHPSQSPGRRVDVSDKPETEVRGRT
jgi:integrase